jgi:hypothetical protein
MKYLDDENLPGMLLCLDFEKAFDSLNWGFMIKVLRAFNFDESFCRWIETFYRDIKSSVLVNGKTTEWFSIHRGCRQGDPISPYLFILSVEILATMIRENENIKGITINGKSNKISQFADDTQLFNVGDQGSFEASLSILKTFGSTSGLFLNADKTEAVWLGSLKNSRVTFAPHLKIIWNPKQFKVLGIWFGHDLIASTNRNYTDKFKEVKHLFNIWSKRNITPLGRVAVLKSLILSKLIHLWILLPDPPDKLMNDLQKQCYKFVWQGKQDRIRRTTSIKMVKNGGLNIPDVKKYSTSLKLMWISRFKGSKHKWKSLCEHSYPFLHNLEKFGQSYPLRFCNSNIFWKQVFEALFQFGRCIPPKTSEELQAEAVFFNNNITIEGKIITFKKWIERGVSQITHFLNDKGQFYSLAEFKEKYDVHAHFLCYAGVIAAVKKYIAQTGIEIENNSSNIIPNYLKKVFERAKGSKIFYGILTDDSTPPHCCKKWESKCNINLNWEHVFFKIHKIWEIKLKWLQIRIVHRILGTNIILKEMGITQDALCGFCARERDDIEHFLWGCDVSQRFWDALSALVNEKCTHVNNFRFTQSLTIFGVDVNIRTDKVLDYIILLAKSHIYFCKNKKRIPSVEHFISYLINKYVIEKHNALIRGETQQFNIDWAHYQNILR